MPPQANMQELKEIASSDPFTVITNAKKDLHNGETGSPWLEEAVSRFEQQCKAGYGSVLPVGSSSSRT